MEDDEEFIPNCNKCKKIDLLPENEEAIQIWNLLQTNIVANTKMGEFILNKILANKSNSEILDLLDKLEIIYNYIKENMQKEEDNG